MRFCRFVLCTLLIAFPFAARVAAADAPPADASSKIGFTTESLANGLNVIYVPLHQAPVVHVRVLYHVGSRDERPDRQGFAHMFEHMMFRGSAHVPPEEHMKLIGMVGGMSNAFTSFDQTVYVNTIPSNQLEMALYLEADRMASFKVSEDIYKTERKVVAEEWRMGQNRPYGTMYEDFLKNAFVAHSYRWTPIGKMEHLQAAAVNELQDFFNTYYVPNNATLILAGDFQPDQAKALVAKYFGWIPKGKPVEREIPAEPEQTQMRKAVAPQRVPLPAILIGYKTPEYKNDDHYALTLLSTILGDGRSSRLERLLVDNEKPLCVSVGASDMTLEDAGVFIVSARVLQGKSPDDVTKALLDAIADVREKGVTEEELKKAKTQVKVALVHERETAERLASQVGEEAVFGGNPDRVNTQLEALEKVTAADVKAVAEKYLQPQRATDLLVKPDPLGKEARAVATQADATINAPTHVTKPIEPRAVKFPEGYPERPPMAKAAATPEFAKGTEMDVNGIKVVVMTDNRLPLVNWSLTMRRGSHSEPKAKKGLASMTAEMLRRGTTVQTYQQLNDDLESRGITIGVGDGGDTTHLSGSCTTDQLDHAMQRSREMLLQPRWDAGEFANVKDQHINQLLQSQESPQVVATQDLSAEVYAGSVLAEHATPQSAATITLDDVKQFYTKFYKPTNAVLVIAGDVTAQKGKELAEKLLAEWKPGPLPEVDYALKPQSAKRKIILVDRPEAKGVTIDAGIRAYDVHNDDKYAGSLAGQVLTGSGIDSRLMKYVRAEKGLVYGIRGYFTPTRHAGMFLVSTETRPDAVGETIEAAFHVLEGMRSADVTEQELTESKLRVAGSMVMEMQTIEQQAGRRLDVILNDYPLDYFDKYPARLARVNAEQVRAAMNKYVKPDEMTIVVVAPASAVKPALEKFGDVEVRPMPAARGATTKPAEKEILKPAA
jgi:zinc protease